MKKKLSIITMFSLLLSLFTGVAFANAATDYASSVMSSSQGMQKDGNPVDAARSDPNDALGASDGVFFSLGYEGEIVLEFPVKGHGNLMIATQEITTGEYPLETADVWVSADGVSWDYVGMVTNEEGEGDGMNELAIEEDICVKYVRLIDTTDGDLHGPNSDGFDLDSVSFTYDRECIECEENNDGNDVVRNENHAQVRNQIHIMANTGGNYADGSYGGDGGDGGTIHNDEGDVDEVDTGNGAMGGDANAGGEVMTGNATVNLNVENHVNLNDTRINREGDDEDGDVRVINRNRAMLENEGGTLANTGANMAMGSYGGEGGSGGDVNNEEGDVDESSTGSGAAGGSGSLGGLVQTGDSNVRASIFNRVNENITRIRR